MGGFIGIFGVWYAEIWDGWARFYNWRTLNAVVARTGKLHSLSPLRSPVERCHGRLTLMSAGLVRLWQRRLSSAPSSSARILSSVLLRSLHSPAPASSLIEQHEPIKPKGKWLTLPPFSPPIDGVSIGKELAGRRPVAETEPMSALKWVRRCCPHLPVSLVHKLFRLRQVVLYVFEWMPKWVLYPIFSCKKRDFWQVRRDQTAQVVYNGNATSAEQGRLRRVIVTNHELNGYYVSLECQCLSLMYCFKVSVKDAMMPGEVIFLPVSVQNLTTEGSYRSKYNDVEISFVRSLELYKVSIFTLLLVQILVDHCFASNYLTSSLWGIQDEAIIVVNKPPGMPVQVGRLHCMSLMPLCGLWYIVLTGVFIKGGVGIRYSMDALAANCLKYECSEPPRLVSFNFQPCLL